ncbi:hypothetical protein HanRHA438_Chr08g0335821 [Helianthus annuus]|nr:hypothetical protein HanRHA438_Chr08g0335821 [Helianthus annuus]
MVQTRGNQIGGSGIFYDSIAARLEIISEKLDSLLSLKNDIAAIREAWLARQTQLTKEPEDEPNGPLPGPVKEEDLDSINEDRFEHVLEGQSKISDHVLGGQLKVSYHDLGGQLKIRDGVYAFRGSVRLKVRDGVEKIWLTNHPMAVHSSTNGDYKVWVNDHEKVAVHRWKQKKKQLLMAKEFVIDCSPSFTSFRLEDKSFFRAGSIDRTLPCQRVDPYGSNGSWFNYLDPVNEKQRFRAELMGG